jgi:uncharacterized protein
MAARKRRLRIGASIILATAWLCTSCSLIKPTPTEESKAERAQALAADSKHTESAQAYEALAAVAGPQSDYYRLRAAEQWAAAGDFAAAANAMTLVSPDARAKLPILRAIVAAQIDIGNRDGVGAIRELDQIQVPTQVDEAQDYWLLRGRGAFLAGHPAEGTRAFVERERFLPAPDALRASRQELFALIRNAAEHGNSLKVPPRSDAIVAGWLELGPIALEMMRNPMGAAGSIAAWRQRYPQHPANEAVLPAAQNQLAAATQYPNQIALLLPLSGRSETVGIAVRDGFIAAYLEQASNARPRLKIYDVAAETPAAAFQHAVADGASFVVGPLTKEGVAAVAPLVTSQTPLLALNFLPDSIPAPNNLFQFALLPEDEARAVAKRVVADGKLSGVALAPSGEWGTRVLAAFSDELAHQGGHLLDSRRYESGRADFSDVIHEVLQIQDVKGEPSTHRTDADFIFVAAGSAGAARLIRPQLKFHYAGDVPMYSTSDSFEPDPNANADLDGMIFEDMPWMISSDPVTSQIRNEVRAAWPARAARRGRLYAFGFDAYRLVPSLRNNSLDSTTGISGMTGRLRLDQNNRIRRDLDWAEMKGGVPRPL